MEDSKNNQVSRVPPKIPFSCMWSPKHLDCVTPPKKQKKEKMACKDVVRWDLITSIANNNLDHHIQSMFKLG